MKILHLFFVIALSIQSFDLSAQKYSISDTTIANELADSAYVNLNRGKDKAQKATNNINKSIEIYESLFGQDYGKLIQLYFLKYQTLEFSDFEERLKCIENSIRITKLIYGTKDKRLRKLINGKGYVLGCKSDYKIAIDYLKQYISLFENESEIDFDGYENTFQSIANYYQTLKEPDSAILYNTMALDILHRSVNSKFDKFGLEKIIKNHMAICYLQKGEYLKYDSLFVRVESMMGENLYNQIDPKDTSRLLEKYLYLADKAIDNKDYSNAIELLKYYLKVLDAFNPSLYKAKVNELINIGELQFKIEEYPEAYENFEKAANLAFENLLNDKFLYAACLEKMVNCKLRLHEYSNAIGLLNRSVEVKKKIDPTGIELVNTYLKLAETFALNQNADIAENLYQQCIDISKSKQNMEFLNKTYSEYAQFLSKQNRFDEASSTFKLSFDLCNTFNKSVIGVKYVPAVIQNLKLFAKIQRDRNLITVDSAIYLYDKMFELIDVERKRTYKSIGKISTEVNYKPYFEEAISCLIDSNFEQNKGEKIEKALSYCEKNKSIKLEESLKKNSALKFSGIPDSIIKTERHLSESIARVHKLIYESEGKSSTSGSNYMANLMLSEGQLIEQYKTFNLKIENEYPKYYKLKNSKAQVELKDIQVSLQNDHSALLSYFVGDQFITIFLVKPDTIIFRKIPNDFNLSYLVKSILTSTTGFQVNPNMALHFDSLANSFVSASSLLFEKLIKPLSTLLPRNLTIIPDEVLGYLPFEVLLVEKPENSTRFNRFHYLLNDHIISYAYSVSTWLDMRKPYTIDTLVNNLAAYAPFYKSESVNLGNIMAYRDVIRKDLNPLPYSGEEALRISKMFDGSCYLGNSGTKQNFINHSKNSRILHIATHAQANDKLGDYCFLVFAGRPDSLNNEVLYANDIYNIELNSEMVTLSACETGIGQLKGGEGIISLSRAFAYAGAKSIVTSLWQVSDSKTKDLMISFYSNLLNGLRKDEALWKAKCDYLLSNKGESASPFYWAGFIGIGNMQALKL